MEEISATDSIKREILDDARARAEHVLRQAEARVAEILSESELRKAQAVEELFALNGKRIEHERAERLARLPLERGRLRMEFLDRVLQSALDCFIGNFDEERVAELAARILGRSGSRLDGRAVQLRYRGLSPELALAALGKTSSDFVAAGPPLDDPGLAADGLVVETDEGRLTLRATMDLVKEELADRHRGELARALCGKAAAPC